VPNFKKYKKLKIGYGKSIPLKLIEYTRNQLRSRKFNNGTGKKVQLIDFINHIDGADNVNVTSATYEFEKKIGDRKVKFNLRKKSSDTFVYNQVIELEEYRFLVDFLEDTTQAYNFLDVGANVGLATLYMSAHFPNAKIYCLEPESSNFSALKDHIGLNHLSNATLLNKGLYAQDGVLFANRSFRDGELWSFALDEKNVSGDKEKFEVISFTSLLKTIGVDKVDFMKVDIEGGELPLLKDQIFLDLLKQQVRIVMMEIHPEVISYMEAKNILRSNGFIVFDIGGSSVGLNKNLALNNA
jgi:FkbM family methyltransferase